MKTEIDIIKDFMDELTKTAGIIYDIQYNLFRIHSCKLPNDFNDKILEREELIEKEAMNIKEFEKLKSSAEQNQTELELFHAIEENSWDLKCRDTSTGGDDYNIGWIIVEHHQAEPKERIIGRGSTALEAIKGALKGDKNDYI